MRRPDPELAALLEQGRLHRRVPASVRARVLARAREIASSPAGSVEPRTEAVPSSPTRGGRRWQIPFAATVALIAGGAIASTAVLAHRFGSLHSAVLAESAAVRPPPPPPTVSAPSLPLDTQPSLVRTPSHSARPANPRESYAAELQLLNRSQAAFATGNLSGALMLLAEHARRFPRGRLAEEREAVRIRSLAGLGLTLKAQRAATIFANRFPRSALLPRVREWVASAPSGD